MSVIDDKGRVFGRLNIVDALVLLFIVVLIPLAYGTVLLFRPAMPRIDSAWKVDITNEERRIVGGGSLLTAKIKVKGTAFNPMLRASIGGQPALAFVFENPNSADVLVGPVPPGAHDLVLFDGVQEVARAKGAVVIDNPATRVIRAEGWLTNLEPAIAADLKVGSTFPPATASHEIVDIGPPRPARTRIRLGALDADMPIEGRVERRAVVNLRCDPQGADFRTGQEPCTIGGQAVLGTTLVTVSLPGPAVTIGFAIEEIFPTAPPARARIRVVIDGPEVSNIKAGDRDELLDGRAAIVSSIQGRTVTLDLGVDDSREGWRYRGHLVKAGAALAMATARYETSGRVESVTVSEAAPAVKK